MVISAVLLLVLIYPLFTWLVGHRTFGIMLVVQAMLGVLMTGYFAALSGRCFRLPRAQPGCRWLTT